MSALGALLSALDRGADPREVDAAAQALIEHIDVLIGRQLDLILHHPTLQQLEAAWRGLWLVVSRIGASSNAACELINCSKADLCFDLEDAPDVAKWGLHKLVYSELCSFAGRPYAVVVADYRLDDTAEDLALLAGLACVGLAAMAVFLVHAQPTLLGCPDAETLAAEGPRPATQAPTLEALRRSSGARFVGLTPARVLARAPHVSALGEAVPYREQVRGAADCTWQGAGYAIAAAIVGSFALSHHGAHFADPVVGIVDRMPTWAGESGDRPPRALELSLSPERVEQIAQAGLLSLIASDEPGSVRVARAPSLSSARAAPADLRGEDRELFGLLPATLLVARLGHYLNVQWRERLGAWEHVEPFRSEMLRWLDGLGEDELSPDPRKLPARFRSRTRRPLRSAELQLGPTVEPSGKVPFQLRIVPRWSAGGGLATLALDGQLDAD